MCTLSIIPLPLDGFRLAMNRDELRARPPALPPELVRSGARRVVMPIDAQSRGTWVAVNDAGVSMALLNGNPPGGAAAGRVSRGVIIPKIIDCGSAAEAMDLVVSLNLRDFAPFRLIIVDSRDLAQIRWDGEALSASIAARPRRPMMWTSSGLGDHLVDPPRRELFERMFTDARNLSFCPPPFPPRRVLGGGVATQDHFHFHTWPDRPHLGVCMRRGDAQTVSFTTIEVQGSHATLTYLPDPTVLPSAVYRHALTLHPNADAWARSSPSYCSRQQR